MNKIGALLLLLPATLAANLLAAGTIAAQPPSTRIHNGQLTATLALPDALNGYYRGTRFDWSGIISSLQYHGHDYVTPWSDANDPTVGDFEYRGDQIVTGPNTTMVGLPEEFLSLPAHTTLGWEEAKVGGTFVKIGVGVLRKPDEKPYDHFRTYDTVRGSQWVVHTTSTSVTFKQTVTDPSSGYGYVYTKKVALVPDKAELTMEHTLRNSGSKPIKGMVYDHNFLRWDNDTPGPDYSLQFAFDAQPSEPLGAAPLAFNGRTVTLTRPLVAKDSMRVLPVGFGNDPADYDFRVENKKLHIGLRITADQPLARATIWGIRSVFALEPFINYDIPPGSTFSWKYTYQAYDLTAE